MTKILGDLGSAVVIIFIFSILHALLAVSIGISNIKNNWEYYKCNPSIMPFAQVFGFNVEDNFNECVQRNQVDFMSGFLEPIYKSLSYFAQNGKVFADMFESIKLFGNNQNRSMGSFTEDARGRLLNLTDSAKGIFIDISDTFSKLTTAITSIYYGVQATLVAADSSYRELPGLIVKIATLGKA